MGDVRGFMKYHPRQGAQGAGRRAAEALREFLEILPAERAADARGAAAWIAAFRFATPAARWETSFPTGTTWSIATIGSEALDRLHATNNFPEFTGRVCPAPCEAACVLGINEDPVAIKQIEMLDRRPRLRRRLDRARASARAHRQTRGRRRQRAGRPGRRPAAQSGRPSGHRVRAGRSAGRTADVRHSRLQAGKMARLAADSSRWKPKGSSSARNANVGVNVPVDELRDDYDAMLLAGGATQGRDLPIPGRELKGVHFAMEFLPQQNKVNQGDTIPDQILATGKHVIVIGGGDTGSDCTGTSNRHGCASLTQFELLPQPPDVGPFPRAGQRPASTPWPNWPMILRTSTSHEEGCQAPVQHPDQGIPRRRNRARQEPGHRAYRVDQRRHRPARDQRVARHRASLALPVGAVGDGLCRPGKARPDQRPRARTRPRGNVKCDANYQSSVDGVFAAGDLRRGQSLVVWAIHEGREAARAVDKYLMGVTHLPSVNAGDFAWR